MTDFGADPALVASQSNPQAVSTQGFDPGEKKFKPGTRRYTVEMLKAGQARPYADDVCHARVTFEWVPYLDGKSEFEPCANWTEEAAMRHLKGLGCGFTDYKYDAKADGSMDAYFRTRLDWLRETAPGVWEFQTTSAFTD